MVYLDKLRRQFAFKMWYVLVQDIVRKPLYVILNIPLVVRLIYLLCYETSQCLSYIIFYYLQIALKIQRTIQCSVF